MAVRFKSNAIHRLYIKNIMCLYDYKKKASFRKQLFLLFSYLMAKCVYTIFR